MISFFKPVIYGFGFVFILITGISAQSTCLTFTAPSSEKPVINPLCTLSVAEDDCPRRIKKVEFAARYFPDKADTSTVAVLGTVTHSPFEVEWDLSRIPNQLFVGAILYADVTFSNDDVTSLVREGIYCIHQPVQRPVYPVVYNFQGTKTMQQTTIDLSSPPAGVKAYASAYWNEKELVFIFNVRDLRFSSKMSGLGNLGAEILLDPSKTRKPFPGDEVFLYTIPLDGKPYRIMYTKEKDEHGADKVVPRSQICPFDAKITLNDGKGFTIFVAIPVKLIGSRLPETIGCNVGIKNLALNGGVARTSWVASGPLDFYSPYTWGELQLKERPFFMNRLLIMLLFFGIGFLLTLFIAAMLMAARRPGLRRAAAQSEADRQQFMVIKADFDSKVTEKNVGIENIAKAVNMQPKKLAILVRQATGMPFAMYIMFARIEIAKERLRSSHASEEAIAEACGFGSVGEMEKYFAKFCHTTPAKFRAEQQVA